MAHKLVNLKVKGFSLDDIEETKRLKLLFKELEEKIEPLFKEVDKTLEVNFEVVHSFNSKPMIHIESETEVEVINGIQIKFLFAKEKIRVLIMKYLLEAGAPADKIYFSAGEKFAFVKAINLEKKEKEVTAE